MIPGRVWTTRPPLGTRLDLNNPLTRNLVNAWVPYGWNPTPNLVLPSNALAKGNATAAAQVGKFGVGGAKTANGFTNVFTAPTAVSWKTVVALYRATSNNSVGLFGNSSQGSGVYITTGGNLSVWLSSGSRLSAWF